MSTILVDLDGVMVDWTSQFNGDLAKFYPDLVFEELREFSTPTYLPQEQIDAINFVKYRTGFYAEMQPIPGAIEAVVEMAFQGHSVWFCSSPEIYNESCESDKKSWLMRHMGDAWAKRLILTRDKTLVRGDYLIDDRPDVWGEKNPEWIHILFSQPYNDHIHEKPRIDSWDQWRTIFEFSRG